jgi:hypothetical protein
VIERSTKSRNMQKTLRILSPNLVATKRKKRVVEMEMDVLTMSFLRVVPRRRRSMKY